MEIPGSNFRIKGKAVQDRIKVGDKKSVTQNQSGASSTSGTEQIAISSKAKDIQKATEAVNTAPDIRTEKVERIKNEIAKGDYRVSSEDLAEKFLENIITESKFLRSFILKAQSLTESPVRAQPHNPLLLKVAKKPSHKPIEKMES